MPSSESEAMGARTHALADAVASLSDGSVVVYTGDRRTELDRQRRTMVRLHETARTASGGRAYLAQYDALMRVVEIALLRHGYRFGQHPHRALKELVVALLSPPPAVNTVVGVRHLVKKKHYSPSPDEIEQVIALRKRLTTVLDTDAVGMASLDPLR